MALQHYTALSNTSNKIWRRNTPGSVETNPARWVLQRLIHWSHNINYTAYCCNALSSSLCSRTAVRRSIQLEAISKHGSAPSYLVSEQYCVKWRTSRLVSDFVLPRLHHWSSAAFDYPPSGTEPFQLPLLVSGTVCPSTSLLHLRCLSSGHASRLDLLTISYLNVHHVRLLVILDTLIVRVTYLLTYLLSRSGNGYEITSDTAWDQLQVLTFNISPQQYLRQTSIDLTDILCHSRITADWHKWHMCERESYIVVVLFCSFCLQSSLFLHPEAGPRWLYELCCCCVLLSFWGSCYCQIFDSLRLCHFSTDPNETFHTY